MADLKGKTILISADANTNYWPWMKNAFKPVEDSQVRPYTFNIQPFVADKNIVQQGYLSSEPYAIEKETKFKPTVLLLSRPRLDAVHHHHRVHGRHAARRSPSRWRRS